MDMQICIVRQLVQANIKGTSEPCITCPLCVCVCVCGVVCMYVCVCVGGGGGGGGGGIGFHSSVDVKNIIQVVFDESIIERIDDRLALIPLMAYLFMFYTPLGQS